MSRSRHPLVGPSIFVLGAGFSKPAGLPLGTELFSQVASLAREKGEYDVLKHHIVEYRHYKERAFDNEVDEPSIDIEKFVSFLDMRLKLGLLHDGIIENHSAVVRLDPFTSWIRYYIAWALHLAQQTALTNDLTLYREFVQRLEPGDVIITFNYDTLLESLLDESGQSYRHHLYTEPGEGWTDTSRRERWSGSEIIILKMHGSIDWFDRSNFDYCQDTSGWLYPGEVCSLHPIFDSTLFEPRSLVPANRPAGDPLSKVYRIDNLDDYFLDQSYLPHDIPLVISPSYHKLLYVDPLVEFWRGLARTDLMTTRIALIGYSLPAYDEYARLALYYLTPFDSSPGIFATRIQVVDYLDTSQKIRDFKRNYRFFDWENTECYFGGFNMEAINMIFDE